MNIKFDEFRSDIRRADGSLIQANVLFVRAKTEVISPDNLRQTIEYHCPIWEEEEYADGFDPIRDAKDLLALQIGQHMKLYGYRQFG